ncbi:unnamed protein product [Lymnaea stagnalis]|uniref:VWFC domain-containing protein n=1 Tax=Lymnaea stagnalis TaxID=6523 RepID=A0AAV2HGQ0_LYMST
MEIIMMKLCCILAMMIPMVMSDCKLNGQVYKNGDMVPSQDCNICTCIGTGIACTEVFCPSVTCTINGVVYKKGARVPVDSCNTCTCMGLEKIVCTDMACIPIIRPPSARI